MMPGKTASKVDGYLFQQGVVCALRTLAGAWFVMAVSVSPAQAACAPDGQGGITNSGGTCSVAPPVNRITATGSGTTTAPGVTLAVPYGIAVTASGGASVSLGRSDAGGAPAISALNGGGLTGLFATGVSSTITADSLAIGLPSGGGNAAARATAGGHITFLNSANITFVPGGGGGTGLLADGAGSQITGTNVTVAGAGGGGDYVAHSNNGGDIALTGGALSLNSPGGGGVAVLSENGSTFTGDGVAISVSASGGDAAVKSVGNSHVSLSGGSVTLNGTSGETGLLAQGATLTAVGVPVSVTASQSSAGTVQGGGTLAITGGSVTASGSGTVGMLVNGAAGAANTLALNDTTVTSTADSLHVVGANANITAAGSTITDNNGVLLSTTGSPSTTTFDAGASTLGGAITTGAGTTTTVTLHDDTDWTVTGNSTATNLTNSASNIHFTAPADPSQAASYKTLQVQNYTGADGNLHLNTFLGSDDAPSDKLIVSGGTATGTTNLTIHNTTGPGDMTVADGIQVVQTLNGGTTASDAFTLTGRLRAGAFDYLLFHGGIGGSRPNDWFLRSSFVVPESITPTVPLSPATPSSPPGEPGTPSSPPGEPGTPSSPPGQPGTPSSPPGQPGTPSSPPGQPGTPSSPPGQPGTPSSPPGQPGAPSSPPGQPETPSSPGQPGGQTTLDVSRPFPADPPASPLQPGVTYPVIGPELATYGVVQPVARQMGFTMLGTLHERIGDTLTADNAGPDSEGWGHSGWARFFGQQIDNRYQAFASPRATGQLLGVQAGVDVWRGSLMPGHRDVAGVYFAYGNSNLDVDGLVTNATATAYLLGRTGKLNLDAYSGGAYWTHYGPGGWYLDLVLQGTSYQGEATTQSARLPTTGDGFVTSLEAGYPVPLPLGPRFVLEPQIQVLWQRVSFDQENDGLGPVDLGSTTGTTGRLGLRGQWTIDGDHGQVWQPYGRVNLWHDWGGRATTLFGVDQVPLRDAATRLEFAAGVTAKATLRLSLYAQAGYQFAVGAGENSRRQGVQGNLGLRYTW
ncbi:outer membrane autotransporter barrel domain protein [Paraburkholderia xenovorans LB400]|nr:autotransporter outer membrane beta-barrel domain-containing protein [Paraburkholderia xenovorans]AIP33886.1 outer membrane autotransporter barrel domain protein [Paraburkholderia xenovorans LB400]